MQYVENVDMHQANNVYRKAEYKLAYSDKHGGAGVAQYRV
jgi:hypothetical protein